MIAKGQHLQKKYQELNFNAIEISMQFTAKYVIFYIQWKPGHL